MKAGALLGMSLLLGLAAGLAFLAARTHLGADLSWQLETMLYPPGETGDRLQRVDQPCGTPGSA